MRRSKIMDDRVCMHYVVDRLEGCLNEDEAKIRKAVEDFREECIYNLGVNTRIRRKGED
jgi:hypothetical protein